MSRSRQNITRSALAIFVPAVLIAGTVWLRAQQSDTRPLSSLFPPGALIYLEAKDLHSLLDRWNASAEKKTWLSSANFGVLSRSRLVGRLAEAQTQFESVAGVPVALDLASQSAGHPAAFAFYDLSALTFLYVTKLEPSLLDANSLWRARAQYQTRQVSGVEFFVKSDPASKRTACFASYKGWFLIATGEDQMAAALTLLSGATQQPSLASERWFAQAVQLSPAQGDLRLLYQLDKLLATPQFRTYWLQRNASELKQFSAGISDLSHNGTVWEEQRALVRQSLSAVTPLSGSLANVLRYVPPSASLYRAWDSPSQPTVSSVLQQVVLSDSTQVESLNRYAPVVSAEASSPGSTADLETRIDQPPFNHAHQGSVEPLVAALMAMNPTAMVHVQTANSTPNGVFVLPASGAVIECLHPDSAALQRALAESSSVVQTGPLDPLQLSVSGHTVVLSRLPLSPASRITLDSQVNFAAAYNHAADWPHYRKMFDLIDRAPVSTEMQAPQAQPPFFSGNVRSLGDTLSSLQRASLTARDEDAQLRETVLYELSAP